MAEWASQRHCLTSIKVWIMSGLRLAWHSDMVSCPLENILLTATADPVSKVSKFQTWKTISYDSPGIEKISWANQDKPGNWAQHPAHHWSGSHELKFSWGGPKYTWTSSVRGCNCTELSTYLSEWQGTTRGFPIEGSSEWIWIYGAPSSSIHKASNQSLNLNSYLL